MKQGLRIGGIYKKETGLGRDELHFGPKVFEKPVKSRIDVLRGALSSEKEVGAQNLKIWRSLLWRWE